MPAKVVV